jgi:hypothetical protein
MIRKQREYPKEKATGSTTIGHHKSGEEEILSTRSETQW